MDLKTARKIYQGAVSFAKTWLALLAQGDFGAANSMIYRTKVYPWTPELLQAGIGSYGASNDPNYVGGEKMKVTPISQVSGPLPAAAGREEEEVVIVEGHEYCFYHQSLPIDVSVHGLGTTSRKTCIGSLDIRALPLNGEWSDLSAVFFIHRINGTLAYELERIEVM